MCVLHVIDGETNEKTRIGFPCSECGRATLLKELIEEKNLHHGGTLIVLKHGEGIRDVPEPDETERAHKFVQKLALSQGWA